MTLNHLHIAASNLSTTQAFYENYFGFRKEREHGRGVFLRDSAGFLIAVDLGEAQTKFPSWFHLGFCLDSEDEVLALYRKAIDGNANIVRELLAETRKYAAFYMTDPDDLRIEVSWHAA